MRKQTTKTLRTWAADTSWSSTSPDFALSYHVFIERAHDPAATNQVAAAIAKRFGLPAQAIAKRLAIGRFRVKADVELSVAQRLTAELEGLGAVCSVVDATAGSQTAPSPPRADPSAPRAPTPAAPPRPAPITPTPAPAAPAVSAAPAPTRPASVLPPRAASAAPTAGSSAGKGDQYQSGLSAAFNLPEDSRADIGVLASVETGSFSLSTLDGDDHEMPDSATEDQPAAVAASDEDLFAPPEMSSEKALELAVDDRELARKTPPSQPAQPAPVAAGDDAPPSMLEQLADLQPEAGANPPPATAGAPAPLRAQTPAPVAAPAESLPVRVRTQFAKRPHLRFAAGLFLAILLGFVPAHIFASIREGSAYDSARADVREAHHEYSSVITAEELETQTQNLEQVRRDARSRMESTQSSIAVTSLIIWVSCGFGIGFVWFRKIDWNRRR